MRGKQGMTKLGINLDGAEPLIDVSNQLISIFMVSMKTAKHNQATNS